MKKLLLSFLISAGIVSLVYGQQIMRGVAPNGQPVPIAVDSTGNIILSGNTPVPASTSTPTGTLTPTATPTPLTVYDSLNAAGWAWSEAQAGFNPSLTPFTATNTPTLTNTPTITNTPTPTNTVNLTSTVATNSPTVTSTPTGVVNPMSIFDPVTKKYMMGVTIQSGSSLAGLSSGDLLAIDPLYRDGQFGGGYSDIQTLNPGAETISSYLRTMLWSHSLPALSIPGTTNASIAAQAVGAPGIPAMNLAGTMKTYHASFNYATNATDSWELFNPNASGETMLISAIYMNFYATTPVDGAVTLSFRSTPDTFAGATITPTPYASVKANSGMAASGGAFIPWLAGPTPGLSIGDMIVYQAFYYSTAVLTATSSQGPALIWPPPNMGNGATMQTLLPGQSLVIKGTNPTGASYVGTIEWLEYP